MLGVQADFVINKGMKGGVKKQSESQKHKQQQQHSPSHEESSTLLNHS